MDELLLLSVFRTFSVFGTSLDVYCSELAIGIVRPS